jgi:molybdopterin molybdotransferase
LRSLAEGENVIKAGEDVVEGQDVLPAGMRLRPAEIGGLMALGLTQVLVARQPRVGIISSGDELVPPYVQPSLGQVRDVNAYTLSALVERVGAVPLRFGIQPDRATELLAATRQALQQCDVVVITAGSSAHTRALTPAVIDSLGEPGVLVHGVNVRPGKPTILAVCAGKAVIGLPGNPVSALVIASLFVTPVLEALLGLRRSLPESGITATLALNLPSQAGREDWVPVRIVATSQGYLAEPVFGKSNLIFTLARADGLIRIPADANGMPAGAVVEVVYL